MNTHAQTGFWDKNASNLIKTTTSSFVGIGTNNPDALTEILYSNYQFKGFIITREFNIQKLPDGDHIPDGDLPPSPIINIVKSNATNKLNFDLATKLYDPLDAPLLLIRTKYGDINSPIFFKNGLMFKSGCFGINTNNPRAVLDVTRYYNNVNEIINYPTVIFSSLQELKQSSQNNEEGENFTNNSVCYTRHIQFVNYLSDNGFSKLSANGDQGIFWTDGAGYKIIDGDKVNGTNTNSGFVIAPWDHSLSGIRISNDGNVSIGSSDNFGYKLAVNGEIGCKKVHVEITSTWPVPDYVFNNDYKLLSLNDLEKFIVVNKHLPDVPDSIEFSQKGMDLTEMNFILLKKVEELTLYIIEQDKRIDKLEKTNK